MTPAVGAGVALAAGAVSGQQQAKKGHTAEKNRKKELQVLQKQMLGNLEAGSAEQFAYQKKANKAAEGGYQSALDDADRVELQGTRQANDYFNQAMGGADASAASRGILGSSVGTSARLGAARQASRYMSDAQIAASHMRTNARLGLGQVQSQGLQSLGSLQAYKANNRNKIMGGMFDYLAGQQFTSQQPDLVGLGMLGGMIGGGFGGGGGGGNSSLQGWGWNPLQHS